MLTRDISLWEAIDVLYGCNRFIFRPSSLLAAYTKIMPHHFARLRIIDFSYRFDHDNKEQWPYLCKIVGGMTNLRNLCMRLHDTWIVYEDVREKHWRDDLPPFTQKIIPSPKYKDHISEKFILDSLHQITQVCNFKVEWDVRK